jgi:Tfp pilus assembly protein PilN
MRAVNLLPKDAGRSTRKTPKAVALAGLVGSAVLVVGLGIAFVVTNGALSKKEQELLNKQTELIANPRPEPRSVTPAETSPFVGERAPRVNALSAALANRISWDRILRRFSLVLPDDIWLQSLAATAPSGAAAAAAPAPVGAEQGFTITGRTYSHDGVARLLKRMQALPDLENVQLLTSHLADAGGQTVVEFTIVAGVRPEGASS